MEFVKLALQQTLSPKYPLIKLCPTLSQLTKQPTHHTTHFPLIVGFDFPWAPHHWFPFGVYGGAPKHDMHHYKPLTNFQPYFNTWDKLMGTWCPPMAAGGFKSKQLLDFEEKKRMERQTKFFKSS